MNRASSPSSVPFENSIFNGLKANKWNFFREISKDDRFSLATKRQRSNKIPPIIPLKNKNKKSDESNPRQFFLHDPWPQKILFSTQAFSRLSLAEIASRLPKSAVFHRLCPEIAVAELPADTILPNIKTLGGIIRIAEYLEESERDHISSSLANILEQTEEGQKIHFAVTTFPFFKIWTKSYSGNEKITDTEKTECPFHQSKFSKSRCRNRSQRTPLVGSSGKYEISNYFRSE